MTSRRTLAALVLASLAATACGGSDATEEARARSESAQSAGTLASFPGITGDLADPDVLVDRASAIWVTATNDTQTTSIPFYRGDSLTGTFTRRGSFAPEGYCHVWAPNLAALKSGGYRLSFSAAKIEGGICDVNLVSVRFVDSATVEGFCDGTRLSVRDYPAQGKGGHTVATNVEAPDAMRIDPDLLEDGSSRWLSYVWFGGGNRIAAFDSSRDTSAPVRLVDPPAALERYNAARLRRDLVIPIYEAPELVKAGSDYYLLYSTGSWDRDYSMRVRRAKTVAGLATAPDRQLTFPLYDAAGRRQESHGHGSVFVWAGVPYVAYHVATHAGGAVTRRLVYSAIELDAAGDVKPWTGQLARSGAAYYSLRNRRSGLCVDVPNGHQYESQVDYRLRLRQWPCNGAPAQRWEAIPVDADDGSRAGLLVRSQGTGLCMTAESGAMAAGQRVVQRPCAGTDAQLFDVEITGEIVRLRPRADAGLCLEIDSAKTAAGADVMVWRCTGQPNQDWSL